MIHEVKSCHRRRCRSSSGDMDDDEDDGSSIDGGSRRTRLVYFKYAVLALFFCTASNMRLQGVHVHLRRLMLSKDMNRLGLNSRRNTHKEEANVGSNVSTIHQHRKQQHQLNTLVGTSEAPLFYHISPGSTGSRTLYHAA